MSLAIWILSIGILAMGIPSGLIISWNARDELTSGARWFLIVGGVSLIGGIIFFVIGQFAIAGASGFMLVVSATALYKSQDSKWVKKRRV